MVCFVHVFFSLLMFLLDRVKLMILILGYEKGKFD